MNEIVRAITDKILQLCSHIQQLQDNPYLDDSTRLKTRSLLELREKLRKLRYQTEALIAKEE